MALLLLVALGLGFLPFSLETPVLPAESGACRFEPIDVCGAGDTSLVMIADTPVLLSATVAVVAAQTVLPDRPEGPVDLLEGFAPGVYRPPRLSS